MGRSGKPVSEDGGVLDWSIGGAPSEPRPKVMKRMPERSETLAN